VPVVDQGLHDLLDEERVPVRARVDRRRQRGDARIPTEQLVEQLLQRCLRERQEGELLVVGLPHPPRLVLGSEVDEHEAPGGGVAFDDLMQDRVAGGIEPMEVLDQHDARVSLAIDLRDPADRRMHAALERLRIAGRQRARGIGDLEQLEEDGQLIAERLVEADESPGDLLACDDIAVARVDPDEGPHQLEDREQRDVLAVGQGRAPHGRSGRDRGSG
jgi:hypothetical protein